MSPEQALGEPIDVRSDVFSFGVMLYEMLSGRRPFLGLTTGALFVAIARDAAPSLRARAPGVDRSTDAIVARCMEKAPASRFAHAGEIVVALSRRSGSWTSESSEAIAQSLRNPQVRRRSRVIVLALLGTTCAGALGWSLARRTKPPVGAVVAAARAAALTSTPPSGPAPTFSGRRLTSSLPEAYTYEATLTRDGKDLVFADTEGFWIRPVAGGERRALGIPRSSTAAQRRLSVLSDGARVFASVCEGDRMRAWLAPLDGGPAQLVREGAGEAFSASPDGRLLALDSPDAELQVVQVEGGPVVAVGSGRTLAACFSPDGRHLAFISQSPPSLNLAAVDGSTVARLWSDASPYTLGEAGIAWPQAGRLLFTSCPTEPGACLVREIAVDDDGHALEPPRELWQTRASALSGLSFVDGRMSVVVTEARDVIRVADLAENGRRLVGVPRRFSRGEANDCGAAWLADGRLMFFSDRDHGSALYAQALDGTDATVLFAATSDAARGAFSEPLRTGEVIYAAPGAASDAGGARIVVAMPGGAEREIGRMATRDDNEVVLCGGGEATRCVMGTRQGHGMALAHLDIVSGKADPPFFHRAHFARFAVSPDGGQVAVLDNAPAVTLVDVATGRSRTMTTSPRGGMLQDATFTPDGQTLIIAGMEFETAAYGLIAVGLDGHGTMLHATSNQWMSGPRVSPDGRRLAFSTKVFDSDVWLLEPQAR